MADFWELKRKSLRISRLLFTFTFVIIFASLYFLMKIIQFFTIEPEKIKGSGSDIFSLLIMAMIALALSAFLVSKANKGRILYFLRLMNARPPDLKDLRHKRLANVVEEMAISAGVPKPEIYVIPSLSKNAFSAFDVIAVTEGLVGLLDRDELQAVVAHEMAHYVNADSFFKGTIAAFASIFTTIATVLLATASAAENRSTFGRRRGGGAGIVPFLIAIYLMAVSLLVRFLFMFISRERELAADAAAVQYTRNPLALASALWKIARDSSTAISYMTDPAYTCLFIINPSRSSLDEKTGWFSELFSTHPPTSLRIKLLLQMAGEKTLRIKKKIKEEINEGWFVNYRGRWIGPFSLQELARKTWLSKNTLLKTPEGKELKASFVWSLLEPQKFITEVRSKGNCPRCGGPLYEDFYEDAPITRCRSCGGVIVKEDVLIRILAREDYSFSETEEKAAIEFFEDAKKKVYGKGLRADLVDPSQPLYCPFCGHKMFRRFYSYAYLIPVDHCGYCRVIFFDSGELELLQAGVERMRRLYRK